MEKLAEVSKSRYFKISPSTARYKQLEKMAESKGCSMEDLVRLAIDFYLEFQEKKIILIAPR